MIGRADTPQLVLLYNTMVLPHLQYCLINWGNFKDDHSLKLKDRILRLQKCFLRIVHSANRLSHADPLFNQMNSLKIDDLFAQSVRCFAFKLWNNMLPARMTSIACRINHTHHTRGSQNNLFTISSDHRSLQYIVPKHWNSLPSTLKQTSSKSAFKVNSKKDLLAPYSNFVCTTRNCRSCKSEPAPPNPRQKLP